MKAYSIFNKMIDAEDGNGDIIFAKSKAEAIIEFKKDESLWDSDYEDDDSILVAKREPELDKYEGQKIPDEAYEIIGWVRVG